jgi:hypothetical protein
LIQQVQKDVVIIINHKGHPMFGLFKKDPLKKLQKEYEAKLEEAMHMQRNGKIREYSFLSSEAEDIRLKIETTRQNLEK